MSYYQNNCRKKQRYIKHTQKKGGGGSDLKADDRVLHFIFAQLYLTVLLFFEKLRKNICCITH